MDCADFSRREVLRSGVLGAAGVLLAGVGGGPAARRAAAAQPPASAGVFRIAHLTDIHVQPERRAAEGMTACMKHVMGQAQRPDLVITGGDLIMDSFGQTRERTQTQWDIYGKVCRDECGVEVVHTLGNHDIWGWDKKNSQTTGAESSWGKRWFCEVAAREKTYAAMDRGGWRIILLDSVNTDPDNPAAYTGRLDEEQFAWLEGEVKAAESASKPVLIVSHIPIMSMCAMMYDSNAKDQDKHWHVSAANMHIDGRRLHRLLAAHRCVKLCLSGHIHKLDRVEMDGVTYICDGAVCGAWWKGRGNWCDEGYGVVELRSDGSFAHRYELYGWKAGA